MAKVLLTGSTGYVGGEVLYTLAQSDFELSNISCLIRNETSAKQVQSSYPAIRIIIGDLDNVALVQQEAEAADIVLHLASTSHIPSAKAIAQGLAARAKKTQSPPHWIQMSGATAYATQEIAAGKFGHASDTIYDDVADRDRILALLRSNSKRVVEDTVLSQSPSTIKTALLLGPLFYGAGRGPGNRRSVQAPEMVKATLRLGYGFKLNQGKNSWSNVHVRDLAMLICLLVRAGSAGKEGMWNEDGVYNVENGEMSFGELGTLIANEAHAQGLIDHDSKTKFETIDAGTADKLSNHAAVLWGTNARTTATRARKMLGWSPKGQSLADTLPDLVRSEAEAVGKVK